MRVLIVEDETSVREVFRDLVTALGHEAIPVESAERGLENLQHDQAEAVLLDVRLPGMSGLAFLEHPEVRAAGVPIVVVSGMASEDEARACLRLGALDYLRKPVTLQRLTVVLELIEPYARARRRAAHREERRQAPRAPVSLADPRGRRRRRPLVHGPRALGDAPAGVARDAAPRRLTPVRRGGRSRGACRAHGAPRRDPRP